MITEIEWISVKDKPVPVMEKMPDTCAVIVKLSKKSCGQWVHGAYYHPNVKAIGHQFIFDLEGEVTHWAWVPFPVEGE